MWHGRLCSAYARSTLPCHRSVLFVCSRLFVVAVAVVAPTRVQQQQQHPHAPQLLLHLLIQRGCSTECGKSRPHTCSCFGTDAQLPSALVSQWSRTCNDTQQELLLPINAGRPAGGGGCELCCSLHPPHHVQQCVYACRFASPPFVRPSVRRSIHPSIHPSKIAPVSVGLLVLFPHLADRQNRAKARHIFGLARSRAGFTCESSVIPGSSFVARPVPDEAGRVLRLRDSSRVRTVASTVPPCLAGDLSTNTHA